MDKTDNVTTDNPFWLGDWYVDPPSGRISRQGAEVKLEPKVMSVLVFLAQNQGEVISRETLEATVWPDVVVSYDALSGTIIKLRKALGDDSRNPIYLETISKKGYRLLATVSKTAPASTTTTDISSAATEPASKLPQRTMLAVLATILVIGLMLLSIYISDDNGVVQQSNKPSVVVLPFINLNNDPAQEYLSDGITDDLINDLSAYSSLHVVARRSAYIYKRRHADIQTIAKELGVSYVLDGSVRREREKIRVNVQLIDAATGLNIWAQRFDEQTRDIFTVQDHIRMNIVRKLSITLSNEERERTRRQYTSNFEAYDLFLQGQAKLVTRASASDNQAAQQLMEKAIELDPVFVRAYAALALIHADAWRFDWTNDPEQTRQQALTIGKRAIELDSKSHQAHWILGYIYLFLFEDHTRAIELAKIATQLAPFDNDGFNLLAVTYAFAGQPEKAKLIIQEIMKKNQRYSSMVPGVLGHASFIMGNYPEALAAYNHSLAINPSRINANVYKILVLYRMGNKDDAEFQVDELYNLHPDFDLDVWTARQPFKDRSFREGIRNDLLRAGVKL